MALADAKYKRLDASPPNSDIYQMTAYLLSSDLPQGTLIYATGDTEPVAYVIRGQGKTVVVRGLNLNGTPAQILERVDVLAESVAGASAQVTTRG